MKILYCHDSVVPIDKIASVFIIKPGPKVIVRDVTGHNHCYYDGSNEVDDGASLCRTHLNKLAAWLKADAPDREP